MPPAKTPTIDLPSYWLVALERAVSAGDYPKAAAAQEQLKRLGIEATLRYVGRDSDNRRKRCEHDSAEESSNGGKTMATR